MLIDFILHFDEYLNVFVQLFGVWIYLILFLIIFAETGFIVTPFLPGDSLLFAAGTLAATGSIDVALLIILLSLAGILGDTVNYAIGKYLGDKLIKNKFSRFIKKEHLDRTHRFYEKYGGKTIVLARFIPIVRTFAPFVAGIGKMSYFRFVSYNIFGAILWVSSFVLTGYYFGNIRVVKDNFSLVILGIVAISVFPVIIEYIRHYINKRTDTRKNP